METNDAGQPAQARAAESPTMTALRRIMIASSMGMATVALVAANTGASLGITAQAQPSTPTTGIISTITG
ncbi:hypothetical protein [Brachybacterium hainanense]|uniref:Uncharacterized protein n=1 Tax=Brachybacterium hainanense TaxID=1541174 RepID=A0ABV6RBP9_9MICO